MSPATQFLTRQPRSPELFGALTPLGLSFLTLSCLSVSSPLFRVTLKKKTNRLLPLLSYPGGLTSKVFPQTHVMPHVKIMTVLPPPYN